MPRRLTLWAKPPPPPRLGLMLQVLNKSHRWRSRDSSTQEGKRRTPTASSGGYGRRRNRGSPVYGDQKRTAEPRSDCPHPTLSTVGGGRLNRAAHAASASPDQAGRARLTNRRATVPVAQLGGTGGVEPRRPNPRTSPSEASPCGYLSKKITTRLFLNSFASSPASTTGCVVKRSQRKISASPAASALRAPSRLSTTTNSGATLQK